MNRVSDDPTTTPHPKRIATALRCSPEARISTFCWIQHASQEAARVLIPPTPCRCPVDPSITSTTLQHYRLPSVTTNVTRERSPNNIHLHQLPTRTRGHRGCGGERPSLLTSFSIDGEYTSDTLSARRGSILPAFVAILMVGYPQTSQGFLTPRL
jgi:hypothetical protein